jgi:phage terminase large subunit GpA-like protein
MMDAITDPRIERVTVMKSSRVGYTKACVNSAIGYYIHHDPGSIMIVQPTIEDGRKYSRSELTPMLRDCAVVDALVAEPRSRDASARLRDRDEACTST